MPQVPVGQTQLGPKNEGLSRWPAERPIILDNVTCVYCSVPLDPRLGTKEHVIGRRFVPAGKLNGQWNLIVQACQPCNHRKSKLEDDLSAITMQPDAWGEYAHCDPILAAEAKRKAQESISRRTGRSVARSAESLSITAYSSPAITLNCSMAGPPQADRYRVFDLSRLHLTAFFYWITYDSALRKGHYWPGGFFPLLEAVRSDWGNPIHRAFMKAVLGWRPRVVGIGADGFFKIIIRRHPSVVLLVLGTRMESQV